MIIFSNRVLLFIHHINDRHSPQFTKNEVIKYTYTRTHIYIYAYIYMFDSFFLPISIQTIYLILYDMFSLFIDPGVIITVMKASHGSEMASLTEFV